MKAFLHPAAPYTMQAASNIVVPAVELMYSVANPSIYRITTDGAVTVKSIYNGQPKSVEYPNGLSDATLAIEADANTKISILGSAISIILKDRYGSGTTNCLSISFIKQDKLELLNIGEGDATGGPSWSTEISDIDVSKLVALRSFTANCGIQSIDFSCNNQLASVCLSGCTNIQSIVASSNALSVIKITDCLALSDIDLSMCGGISDVVFYSNYPGDTTTPKNISVVRFRANNEAASSKVSSLINYSTSTSGTVYLNSSDPYYSTVADAATTKGWTVASL